MLRILATVMLLAILGMAVFTAPTTAEQSAAAAAAGGNLGGDVHRTPAPMLTYSEACSQTVDCAEPLEGGPEAAPAPAQVRRVWTVRSSHVPADAWPQDVYPVAIIADVDADAFLRRTHNRGTPDKRHGRRPGR